MEKEPFEMTDGNDENDVRLVGSATEGVVEVYVNGWKAICSNNWNMDAAQVVCHQLGFPSAASVTRLTGTGVNSSIYYNGITCSISADSLSSCKLQICRGDSCCHGSQPFAGVVCQDWEVRVVNGDEYSGIVEVSYGLGWGTICEDNWLLIDADVVCQTLGFPGAERQSHANEFESSPRPVKYSKVDCSGTEMHLRQCTLSTSGLSANCGEGYTIASVVCKKPFRLEDGPNEREGRVVVYVNGVWSRVCDIGWDLTDADVLCSSLGLPGAREAPGESQYGEGDDGDVSLMEDLGCFGNESSILHCSRKMIISDECAHNHDAGVICYDLDECSSNPCFNGGICNDTIIGYVCICPSGYEGTGCEDEIDECSSNPCKNEAACTHSIGAFECQCLPGYSGTICEIDIDECGSSPCENQGICADSINAFTCNCLPGFTGDFCEINSDECESAPCKNGGVCVDSVNGFHCECASGFTHLFCGTDINECSSNPCLNGAECYDQVDGYNCTCLEGYTGNTCGIDVDECQSNPCSANGICRDEIAGFTCQCNNGFTGELCEIDHNECLSSPCLHGLCSDEINSFNCTCDIGFEGIICDTDINECLSNPCQHDGVCIEGIGQFTCDCPFGFDGRLCENDVDNCSDQPCFNGGTCLNRRGLDIGFECTCASGFSGPTCQTNINECASNPCQNGGRCHDWINDYQCDCVQGYSGKSCETEIDECNSHPCLNRGSCIDHVNGFSCICKDGFSGTVCQTNLNECLSSPCLNGGHCIDGDGFFVCSCEGGYNGNRCELGSVQLVNGTSPYDGRVEIFYNNEWGTVCNTSWDLNEARVVCRQISSPGAMRAFGVSPYGAGSGTIVLDDVTCSGYEENLGDCQRKGTGVNNCNHEQDAGVQCLLGIRLVGGTSSLEGRVEVYRNNGWGTVCDDDWDITDAYVVCRELGFAGALEAVSGGSRFERGTGDILLDNVACFGNETRLVNCGHTEHGIQHCDHNEDAGVICINSSLVRLVDGPVPYEGRVEVNIAGEWGTVCDHMWDLPDAQVVCRQLGYPSAIAAPCGAVYGEGSGSIIMDNVRCSGQETQLVQCPQGIPNQHHHTCGHNEDASVVCVNNIRLVNGSKATEGRVEVFLNGQWGTICDDYFDIEDAHVVCRQLGYWEATSFHGNARFGEGGWPILLDNLHCNGNERRISDCDHSGLGVHNCFHTEDISVACKVRVRLEGGPSGSEGRVELYVEGGWGTVCDDNWDRNDGDVVCRELGYQRSVRVTTQASFGVGTGYIILDDVDCSGVEDSLIDCGHRGLGTHNCQHSEDAGVVCLANDVVRLVGGSVESEGRVEIFHDAQWGTVCDDSWDITDATVACRQLGYLRAIEAPGSAVYGPGEPGSPIFLDDVACSVSDIDLFDCSHRGLGVHNCNHGEDAGAVCIGSSIIRLVGGTLESEGRVEILLDGQWGTVCDDGWDQLEANVVCQQLDFPGAISAVSGSEYGQGIGPIHLNQVQCTGNERRLDRCDHVGQTSSCGHHNDAGVICHPRVRLVGGLNSFDGRVEYYYNGRWGTVCDDNWDRSDATVACRELGFGSALEATRSATFGSGTGIIQLDEVQCHGYETNLAACNHNGWGQHNCGHHEDAGVRCGLSVRLVGGATASEGRVEVFYQGKWGTICDDEWGIEDATVVCASLSYDGVSVAYSRAHFGEGSGPILLDNVRCVGSETSLSRCRSNSIGNHNCGHGEDAGVRCSSSESIRLVGGSGNHEGRVEVYMDGQWGTVCDDSWDLNDANVVCRQLGYIGALSAPMSATFGQGSGPILLDDVSCSGSETSLLECNHNGQGNHNCRHSEDAGAICSINGPVRLRGGLTPNQGRVEVFHSGVWGTVCDDSWGITDGTVVCKQLGYPGARRIRTNAFFGQGTGPIYLDDVRCTGQETSITLCQHPGIGIHNCYHTEDAGVECIELVRLVGGSVAGRGRVEVFVDGEWGTVCDDSWDLNDAQVVCRELGYASASEATTSASFGAGSGNINLDDVRCIGDEPSVLECNHAGTRVHNCNHNEDAGVVCTNSVAVRLVGGSTSREGRVEVQINGIWGTVCDDAWGISDANVICRQLALGTAVSAPTNAHFGQGTGQIHLDDVHCNGNEDSIIDCPHGGVGVHNCQHSEDASVVCSQNVNVRLSGSILPGWGRVEIMRHGVWGTICDDRWDINDARVICRMLGFTDAVGCLSFGPGIGPIWLDEVNCSGDENNIADCSHIGWGNHNCNHSEDAGVTCSWI
ncbi:deleted in malignant brain tumors 1 protein-like [Anneissia japonica]|uniref:deleted in malignant brain tumors 1 protein-like n=1 Tax=Anneissia japonica TaxID=1529436 RepID=UPI001425A25F|nr:deleted in malignant brain tumors 1 protein-like [Anneissia japonica]